MVYFILIVVLILGFGAAKHTRAKFEDLMARGRRQPSPDNKTGAEIAAEFLVANEASDVQILVHDAVVSDYFDPRRRRLFLRRETHDGRDLAAWAVALHEAAHAVQSGDDTDAIKWRQTCISLNRYAPVAAGAAAIALTVLLRRPGRVSLMFFIGVCAIALMLNIGTLAVEFNANKRVIRWLEDRLERYPDALDKLQQILSGVATREVGDLLQSPRYFFLSALPGTSKTRPQK